MSQSEKEVNELLAILRTNPDPQTEEQLDDTRVRIQARIADNLGRIAAILEKNSTGGNFRIRSR